jgi:hypothetical protein
MARHLLHPPSAPLAGDDQATLQAACLSNQTAGVRPYHRAHAIVIMTCTLPGKLLLQANATEITDIRVQGDCTGLMATSTTTVMLLGPHVGAQHPCTCPP